MIKEKLYKLRELTESVVWVVIFTTVIFINISPQLIRAERLQFVAIFSFLLFVLVFNRLSSKNITALRKNIIRAVVYLTYIAAIYYALRFQKYSVWIFYVFPLIMAFSLSVTFITQPRTLTLILVGISVFLLGDIYWEARMSIDAVRVVFPLTFSKVFSLSLLSVFGYYLYRSQLIATRQAEIYSQNLKILNQELSTKTDELEKANKRLKDLSEVKSVFVATVSHELRTPLTAIQNSLKLIGYETKDNQAVNDYVGIIKRNIDRQAIMIDNLLDTARIERGSIQGTRTKFELNKLLQEAVDILKIQASGKNVSLNLYPSKDDSSIWGDQEQLRRVFINLADNAIKFTPASGKVEIFLVHEDSNIKVTIADTGCGIRKEEQEKIFDAFIQAEAIQQSNSISKKGIGLGLTIVREIINRHGGKVWVDSEVGKGSRFHVLLPMDLRRNRR